MRCNDTLWQLPEDGHGDPARDEDLRAHLGSCPDCRDRMAALQDAVLLLRKEPREAPATGFSARVMQRIAMERAAEAVPVPPRLTTVAALAVVSTALAALGLVWVGSEAVFALSPGTTLLTGMAGLVASFVNVLVMVSAVINAVFTGARALPSGVLQAIAYSVPLCCVLFLLTLIWLAARSQTPYYAGSSHS